MQQQSSQMGNKNNLPTPPQGGSSANNKQSSSGVNSQLNVINEKHRQRERSANQSGNLQTS